MTEVSWRESIQIVVFILVIVLTILQPVVKLPCRKKKLNIPLGMFLASIIGLVVLVATTALSFSDLEKGFVGDKYVQPYGIMLVFFSLAYTCISLDVTGVLAYIALWAARKSGARPRRLFFVIYLLSTVFTIVTSNDIVILTLTPIIVYVSKAVQVNPLPLLLGQFHAANTWSALLMIGNPTNLIVAIARGIDFVAYSKAMTLPSLIAGLGDFVFMWVVAEFLFRREPRSQAPPDNVEQTANDKPPEALADSVIAVELPVALPEEVEVVEVEKGEQLDSDEDQAITTIKVQKGPAIFGFACLALSLALVATANWTSLPVWAATIGPAIAMFVMDTFLDISLLRQRSTPKVAQRPPRPTSDVPKWRIFTVAKRMPWAIAPFLVFMFSVTEAFSTAEWFKEFSSVIGKAAGSNAWTAAFLPGCLMFALCNLLNNQPATILLVRMVGQGNFAQYLTPAYVRNAEFAIALASNIGANLTLIGALAGIMWKKLLRDHHGPSITYFRFFLYGVLTSPFTLALGLATIALL